MGAVVFFVLMFAAVDTKSFNPEHAHKVVKRSTVCFEKLRCFSNEPPFSSVQRLLSVLPQSPDQIVTKFQLYTRKTPTIYQEMDARYPETANTVLTHFAKMPSKFIIHGFMNNPQIDDWLKDMKDELLKAGDFNVVIVNWSGGNQLPYTQASANTRVVGTQLALVIQELIKSKGVTAADFHIIGHSLGAHVAGYAGERVPGLGRITGLDPAGPYFDNTDKTVRLDSSDAVFVDVIHTDAENVLHMGFGTKDQGGHADFYPNLGHDQPGCSKSPITHISENGFWKGMTELMVCNHRRSIRIFTESINTKCPFIAFPCDSERDFHNNNCHVCPATGCPSMGFKSRNHPPPNGSQVNYFLTTSRQAPFCQYHLALDIKFSAGKGREERGTIQVEIHGETGSTGQIPVTDPDHPIILTPGTTYSFNLGVPANIGSVQSIIFTWEHNSSLLDLSTWNIFGLRSPTLYLDEVKVKNEEFNLSSRFCVKGRDVETDTTLAISTRC